MSRLNLGFPQNLASVSALNFLILGFRANQLSSQSGSAPRDSTWQCVCFRNQKRKPKLYLIPARHFLSTPIESISSSETASIHATSGVSEVQRCEID